MDAQQAYLLSLELPQEIANKLKSILKDGDNLLIKASFGMNFEEIYKDIYAYINTL